MCKDACLVQGEVWTVAHGCGAIRAAAALVRAFSAPALVLAATLATALAAVIPTNALAASTSGPTTASPQPISHTGGSAARTQPPPHATRATACPSANLRPSPTNTATIDAATLCLIDRARAVHRLHPLLANRELQAVAISQVTEMVRLDYFSDTRPSGTTPAALIAATPYGRHARSLITAESIGWGTGRFATPSQMVTAWLASPAHREIVLSGELLEVGVGAVAAAPARLAQDQAGATYALELARR